MKISWLVARESGVNLRKLIREHVNILNNGKVLWRDGLDRVGPTILKVYVDWTWWHWTLEKYPCGPYSCNVECCRRSKSQTSSISTDLASQRQGQVSSTTEQLLRNVLRSTIFVWTVVWLRGDREQQGSPVGASLTYRAVYRYNVVITTSNSSPCCHSTLTVRS